MCIRDSLNEFPPTSMHAWKELAQSFSANHSPPIQWQCHRNETPIYMTLKWQQAKPSSRMSEVLPAATAMKHNVITMQLFMPHHSLWLWSREAAGARHSSQSMWVWLMQYHYTSQSRRLCTCIISRCIHVCMRLRIYNIRSIWAARRAAKERPTAIELFIVCVSRSP